ncbi:chorismate-binding protein [Marinilabilia sp.]|uniref:chorismate-binding protein n=1 Tax=Marinilabilia sp. TaxID=2021252 RepID=UPI0025C1CBB8|nr:chorismate-binding protein [Marinilabilia sp.]
MDNKDYIQSAEKAVSAFINGNRNFVAWRMPGEEQGHAFSVGDIKRIDVKEFSTENFEGAFIVAPFRLSEGLFALWPEDKPAPFEVTKSVKDNTPFQMEAESAEVRTLYGKSFSLVKQALDKKLVDKVVLARKLNVDDVPSTILPGVFELLCITYPNAFVYFIDHPETGRWMGASPELFLEKSFDSFRTVALAATRKTELHSEDWNMKELEEQGLVSVFVDEVLSSYGINQYKKSGPEPVRAGAMVHLRTSYQFKDDKIRKQPGKFIDSLHPTPAVGGYPKEKSLEVLIEAEKFERGFYSGFLGPVSKEGFRFFVNIRSMQLGQNNAVLYLGGGITRGSREENEWEETRLKARTLLSVLKSVKQKFFNESIHLR